MYTLLGEETALQGSQQRKEMHISLVKSHFIKARGNKEAKHAHVIVYSSSQDLHSSQSREFQLRKGTEFRKLPLFYAALSLCDLFVQCQDTFKISLLCL